MRKEPPLMHNLVPTHELLSDEQKQELFATLKIEAANLPRIYNDDPALILYNVIAKSGDVVKILRKEPTGDAVYYRLVIE